jgi:hypothetical protein
VIGKARDKRLARHGSGLLPLYRTSGPFLCMLGVCAGLEDRVLRGRCLSLRSGKILLSKLLDGSNHLAELLALLRELILDPRRNLQEGLPLYKTQFLQQPQPLGQGSGTDASHQIEQFIKWVTKLEITATPEAATGEAIARRRVPPRAPE